MLSNLFLAILTSSAFWITFFGFVRLRYAKQLENFEQLAESYIQKAMNRKIKVLTSAALASRASYFNIFGNDNIRLAV